MRCRSQRAASGKHYVLLDRDGTIIEDRKYLVSPGDVEILPRAINGLRRFSELGLGLVIVTNQSAIGRGLLDLSGLNLIHAKLKDLLSRDGIAFDAIYYCPHLPSDGCICRKPEQGMLEQATIELGLNPAKCFVIGDQASDIELGQRAGAITFLVSTGGKTKGNETKSVVPDYYIDGLDEAADVIEALLREEA